MKKFLSLVCAAALVAAAAPTAVANNPIVQTILEPMELVYNDASTGTDFENFTYASANPNKTYTLTGGLSLGEGDAVYRFHLDCGGENCRYRAGMIIAGKTILVNALDNGNGTTTGDWPSHNNDWHVDGYHINYNYHAVTADVTLTAALNSDGKAVSIDCMLIDGQNAQAHNTITLEQPASIDTIKLVSEDRGGSGIITLTDFKAEYIPRDITKPQNTVSVEVDYAEDKGVSHRVASGALHGIDYKTPAEYLSDGIYIRALRGQAKSHDIDVNYEYLPGFLYEKTYNRVINRGDDTKLMIGLYYGYKPLADKEGGWQKMAVENDGAFWKEYIRNFMSEYYNEDGTKNRDVYSWIPWNEPDLQWGGLGNNFCQAFENAYDAVKEFDPSARVQGPECSWYESGKMKNFLLYCKENNCMPDVLSWHELTPYKMSIAEHCKELYDFMIANNIEPMEMAVTEYQGLGYDETDEGRKNDGNYNTGLAISYISEMENSEEYGLSYGLRSAWSYGGSDPRAKAYLGEMTDIATATMPTGQWYVYNAYKRMTGRKVGVHISNPYNDDTIAALASVSSAAEDKSSTILIGNWNNGNNESDNAKNISLTLKNIPEYLTAEGEVHVTVEQFPETLAVPLYSPTIISDKTYAVTNGEVELDTAELYGRRAMAVTITTPEADADAVRMSELNPTATGNMTINDDNDYVTVSGGKPPTYKDASGGAPSDTTYKDNGDSVTFTVNVPADGIYNLVITHKTGNDKGFTQLYVDSDAVHYPTDLYSGNDGEKNVNYGNIYLKAGEHKLCFKIVGYGKNEKSTGYTLTFGNMTLSKIKDNPYNKTVTFNPDGGRVSQDSILVKDKAEQLPEITREGYKFLGWVDKNGNTFAEGTTVSENMTVTARWERSFSVKLIGNRDICGLDYNEETKKATITINATEDSEVSVTANKSDMSDRIMRENGKYILRDYDVTEDVVFIVNVTASNSEITDPYIRNEAENYNEQNNTQTEFCSEGGKSLGYIKNGSWIMFKNVNFGSGAGKFEARTTSAGLGGNIELHLDSLDGSLIGTLNCPNNGGWENWETKSCDVTNASGTHDLYLKFTGADGDYLFNINWWQFAEANPSETPTSAPTNAPTETPAPTGTPVPTTTPTAVPTGTPTETPAPTGTPTAAPTGEPEGIEANVKKSSIENSKLDISINAVNHHDSAVNAQTVLALYDGNDILREVRLGEYNADAGKSADIMAVFNLPDNADGYYVKLMLWDDFTSLKPICGAFKYTLDTTV